MSNSYFDYNTAEEQLAFDLIPAGTICKVNMTIKPGNAAGDPWLTQSQSSDALFLKCEFIVMEGEYARRRFWENIVVSGGKTDESGESIAGRISRSKMRAMVESARNILPSDQSPQACEKRKMNGFGDFNGLEFVVKVGVEKDQTGKYDDKNKIAQVITPDRKDYIAPGQVIAQTPAPAAVTAGQASPAPTPAPTLAAAPTNAPWMNTQAAPQPTANPVPAWAR